MCAQHYVEAPCASVVYPERYTSCDVGILMADRGPTPQVPFPPYKDQYFDSYRWGHVRAHLVHDMKDGVLMANDGLNPIIVGGRLVCRAPREYPIYYSQYSGHLIYDLNASQYRCIFIGGEYDQWSLEAYCWSMTYSQSDSHYACITTGVRRLYIGDAWKSTYWWMKPDAEYAYARQYQAWCAAFDSIWSDLQTDGTPINERTWPYAHYNGRARDIWSYGSCTVIEPSYEFVPQGAEYDWLELALSFGQPDGRRIRRQLADSYVAAASELPAASANTLQNMLELGSLIGNLVHGNFSSLADFSSLKNMWLAYRYSYNTTKMDISDYRKVTNRLLALSDVPEITTHGMVIFDNYRARTSITVRADEVIPHDTASFMKAFNAKLSLANTWDAIPWSFVVDWFFHVGDVLGRLEECASAYNLNPVACWSSIERIGGKFYLRFPYTYGGGASVFQDFRCSDKTFIMRIADAICLFSR